jgi:hypothetical protein
VKITISVLAMLIPLSGCGSNPTVWRMDLPSPDGAWLATARTDQYGGFGSALVETAVSLRKLNGTVNRGKAFDVLEYPGGGRIRKPYTLSEANAANLTMKWVTATHLDIACDGNLQPDLQVAKFGGIEITVHQK